MSNPFDQRSSAESAEGVPLPENVCISYIKMVSFYAFPVIFIDIVLFKKGILIKRAGVWTPSTPRYIRPCTTLKSTLFTFQISKKASCLYYMDSVPNAH